MNIDIKDDERMAGVETAWRKTAQFLMPPKLDEDFNDQGGYNIYPACGLGPNKIFNGFASLADYIINQKVVVIDGYAGVFWHKVQASLQACFSDAGLSVNWIRTADLLKPAGEIEKLV